MVRAKFECTHKVQDVNGWMITFKPVTSGSAENEKFYKYTPSGGLDIGTINDDAADQFEVGKEYYLDISPASDE